MDFGSEAALREATTCTICLSTIQNTRAVKECLHRFCRECIEVAMRQNRPECPLCKTRIPSRRSCKEDKAFDALLESIYGDLDQLRAAERKKSEEWWSKNKGSFKHIGESFLKQKEATRGRRATVPKRTKKRREAPPPLSPQDAKAARAARAARRLAPRKPSPGRSGGTSPTKNPKDPGPIATTAEVAGSYLYLRASERSLSERIKEKVEARRVSQLVEEEKRHIMVTLEAGNDIDEELALLKPHLLCKPSLKISSLKRMIESKHPGRLGEDQLHLYLWMGAPSPAKQAVRLVRCGEGDRLDSFKAHEGVRDLRAGLSFVYSQKESLPHDYRGRVASTPSP
ncbi:RING-type domain-containing protein [Chloropicon primus]|uniref:RING-type domain-containing protein n=2 Tax=Chloropicon primus TaxID=1764295 RepID=A0A5B8MJU7_9CHLO|nr:hypothetical protein A3770_04p32150 [Chloropicon primus]UPQ99909.1 RING-type domain-containing protein [Chloropicon primus]|eukprot:QDZ20697.1 hypothetical protein A3770_04p32150 [Chloropicon primus]